MTAPTMLTPMMQGRQDKALDRTYNFSNGVSTFRELILSGFYVRGVEVTVPKVLYNRSKFNRMGYSEQAAYEAKLKETKTEYHLTHASDPDVTHVVPKLVYSFFEENK